MLRHRTLLPNTRSLSTDMPSTRTHSSDAPATSQQRADRREIDAHEGHARRSSELNRTSSGIPERMAEQRVDRQVQRIDLGEPRRPEVLGSQPVRSPAIGDERALPARADKDPDAAGPDPRDPCRSNSNVVAPDRVHQRPPGRVAADGRHERHVRPEASQPTCRRRGRTALHE